jgi:hypothetical protein
LHARSPVELANLHNQVSARKVSYQQQLTANGTLAKVNEAPLTFFVLSLAFIFFHCSGEIPSGTYSIPMRPFLGARLLLCAMGPEQTDRGVIGLQYRGQWINVSGSERPLARASKRTCPGDQRRRRVETEKRSDVNCGAHV